MHPDPSAVLKSIVLVGAITKNGTLCLAARTAALYVPIYPKGISENRRQTTMGSTCFVCCVPVLGDPVGTDD